MPTLDVTDAFDPSFMDDLICERRTQTIDQHGRVVTATTTEPFTGVVGPTSPDDLVRVPEQEMMNKSITVITQFRLQGPSPGYDPDNVIWHGDRFIVRALDDFSGYGVGFVQAVCMSTDSEDIPPQPAPTI